MTQSAACTLSDEQWSYLSNKFVKRYAYRNFSSSQGDFFKKLDNTDHPVSMGENLSHVDDNLLDMELKSLMHKMLPSAL